MIPDTVQPYDLVQKMEPPFQAGGIAYDYNDLGQSGIYKIPGNFFFRRPGGQGISAGKVDQKKILAFSPEYSAGSGNGFSGPVTGR